MKRDWEELTATSYYETLEAIREAVDQNDLANARAGIHTLLDTMSQQLRSASFSQLVRLMKHIIKWQLQPERRSVSWVTSIADAREEIEAIQSTKPSLNRSYFESIWDKAFEKATRQAENETGISATIAALSWETVFDDEYRVPAVG
ncbi:DUF29 family protein [Spirosoma areae]